MNKVARLSFAFAVALSGCASDRGGDDDIGPGPGSGSGEPQPERKLDLVGTYRLHSTFDLATNMPGTSGTIVNGLIEATDDADDPMSWVVDLMLAQMQSGTVKNILVGSKPFVIGYLNDRVTQLAPNLVGTLLDIGERMEDVTKNFGLNERLVVDHVDQTYVGRMTADGVRFKVDTTTLDVLFADHDIDDVNASGIYLRVENESHVTIGAHTMALPYGKIARLALDLAVIPAIDPNAAGLADLLDNVVDCQRIGASVSTALGVGSPALYAGACLAGLDKAADVIYDQLVDSDTKLDLHLTGLSRASDTNQDYKIDKLSAGVWTGTMTYATDDAPLAQPATYVGTRM
jgi:hypothetical protein